MGSLFESMPLIGGSVQSGVASNVLIWTFVIVCICITVFTLFFFLLHMSRTIPVIEIDYETKRIRQMRGVIKKDKSDGTMKLFIRKLKKTLKNPQRKDIFVKGKKDMLLLLKDNNGLHHTLRLPEWNELVKYYAKVKEKDITVKGLPENDIFFLPNPHEDLEWLSDECLDANQEFRSVGWMQSPVIMTIGTAFVCFMMVVMTLILT